MSFIGAVLLLGERASFMAAGGTLLVVSGIFVLSAGLRDSDKGWRAPCWGVATGLTIACYTLVDGYSVRVLLLSPILVECAGNVLRAVALSGEAWLRRRSLWTEYRQCWREVIAVAVLTPLGYILVLLAMRIAPISRVAPAREMSMMLGAYFGSRFLKEGQLARRLSGSVLIAAGVAALASG
ncbi:MAG: hypothetical protein JO249_10680 [Acidobacteria bacterium]|nr:hypothetical protein [Acidobacteriota bacterium]